MAIAQAQSPVVGSVTLFSAAGGTYTVTLGSTPTVGNTMVVGLITNGGTTFTTLSGWTFITGTKDGNACVSCFSRVIQAGDGKSYGFVTSNTGFYDVVGTIIEYSGVNTSTPTANGTSVTATAAGGTTTMTSGSFSSTANGSIALFFAGGDSDTAGAASAITASWTSIENTSDTGDFIQYEAQYSPTVASGSSVTPTVTWPTTTSGDIFGGGGFFLVAAATTAGYRDSTPYPQLSQASPSIPTTFSAPRLSTYAAPVPGISGYVNATPYPQLGRASPTNPFIFAPPSTVLFIVVPPRSGFLAAEPRPGLDGIMAANIPVAYGVPYLAAYAKPVPAVSGYVDATPYPQRGAPGPGAIPTQFAVPRLAIYANPVPAASGYVDSSPYPQLGRTPPGMIPAHFEVPYLVAYPGPVPALSGYQDASPYARHDAMPPGTQIIFVPPYKGLFITLPPFFGYQDASPYPQRYAVNPANVPIDFRPPFSPPYTSVAPSLSGFQSQSPYPQTGNLPPMVVPTFGGQWTYLVIAPPPPVVVVPPLVVYVTQQLTLEVAALIGQTYIPNVAVPFDPPFVVGFDTVFLTYGPTTPGLYYAMPNGQWYMIVPEPQIYPPAGKYGATPGFASAHWLATNGYQLTPSLADFATWPGWP